jgi:hypothetical protein
MTAFHEIDVALAVSVPASFSAARLPAAEVHINPWVSGSKGTQSVTVGTPASVAAGIGIQMTPQRVVAQTNAPTELVLGDTSAGWLVNLAEGAVVSATVTNVSLIFMP